MPILPRCSVSAFSSIYRQTQKIIKQVGKFSLSSAIHLQNFSRESARHRLVFFYFNLMYFCSVCSDIVPGENEAFKGCLCRNPLAPTIQTKDLPSQSTPAIDRPSDVQKNWAKRSVDSLSMISADEDQG